MPGHWSLLRHLYFREGWMFKRLAVAIAAVTLFTGYAFADTVNPGEGIRELNAITTIQGDEPAVIDCNRSPEFCRLVAQLATAPAIGTGQSGTPSTETTACGN